jgi:hypothetical protein
MVHCLLTAVPACTSRASGALSTSADFVSESGASTVDSLHALLLPHQVVKALCYKPEGRGLETRLGE